MRIIGGEFGGRALAAPAGAATRPSAARVREGLASALVARDGFAGTAVLDLFAGSGALGLEALSRGARSLVAVDASPGAIRCITANAKTLGVAERVRAVRLDLLAPAARAPARLAALDGAPFALAFVDAPYARFGAVPGLLAALAQRGAFTIGALVAVEHAAKAEANWAPVLVPRASYRYGDTEVTLLAVASSPAT